MIKRTIKYGLLKTYRSIGRLINPQDSIILVYTMGKVGSSTIYNSIRNKNPFAHIYHIHFLSDKGLNEVIPATHKKFWRNIKLGWDVRAVLDKNPSKRIKVITLVREPVVRSISDLYQNWEEHFENIMQIDKDRLKVHVESLDYEYVLNWFDSEFKEFLKVDIFELPFDKSKGYEVYNLSKVDICCIKLEKLNQVGELALKELLGQDYTLRSANKSENKKGSEGYNFLKKNVKIDSQKLDMLYSSKLMKHFYTEQELANFKRRWGH